MNKIVSKIIFASVHLCIFASLTASAQSSVTVNVKGLDDGTAVCAELGSTFRDEKPIAEATIQNSQFKMTLPVEEPRFICFMVKGQNGDFARLMTTKGENPTVDVTVEKQNTDQGIWYSDKEETVYNSPLHAQWVMKIESVRKTFDIKYEAYHNAYKDLLDKQNAAYAAKDTVLYKQLRSGEEMKGFSALEHDFFTDVEKAYKQIATDNKDTFWGPFSMANLYSYITPEQKPEYDQFSEEAKNSFYGQVVKEQVDPKGFKGEPYGDFTVLDSKGKSTKASKLVKGKKCFLIDFWASWCNPCRKEIPNLKKIYNEYKSKGLEIISVSIDKKDAQWQKALQEEKLPWPNGIDKSGIADQYKVQLIPAIFVVDGKTGKIVAEQMRGEQLEKKVAELLQ